MKRVLVLTGLILFVFGLSGINAQEKQLTLKDAVYLNRDILPGSLNQLQWLGDSDKIAWVENDSVVFKKANSEKLHFFFEKAGLNSALHEAKMDSVKRMPRLDFIEEETAMFTHANKLLLYYTDENKIKEVNSYPEEAKNIEIDKNTFGIAYTVDNNLYLALNGKQIQITDEADPGIVSGQSVHRREFGISKGIFWSPEGKKIAFYKKDESMVTEYPLVDIDKRIAALSPTRYPMAGEISEEVKLGIYDIESGKTVFMKTGEPLDQYLTSITWDPGEKFIYIGILNRGQDHLKFNKYNAFSGDYMTTLFEEKSDRYVEPEHEAIFLKNRPDQFIWFSERDGWNHMYLYDTAGKLIKRITEGSWVVTDLVGFTKNEKNVIFEGSLDHPLQNNVYSVNLKNGNIKRLSPDDGSHSALLSSDGKYFVDIYSSLEVARTYQLINHRGEVEQILLKSRDPMADYDLGEMSVFSIRNEEGTDLFCRLIKPVDFDSTKKYPAIVYVYGGPHSQLVRNAWLGGAQLFMYYLAQEGYVVFTLDNRGTANRGFEFESIIHRNLGKYEVEDQMKGVEYLKSLDYVDEDRMGVDGWSYGGFMTISMILKHPDDFKAAVAGGPVIDWKYYEVMYGERYMDSPQENPEGYEAANLLNYVDQLQADLLILHGTNDPTVVWQNSLQFLKKSVEEGVQVDYFVYPGHPHNVRGKDRMHMYQKILRYFNTYLK